MLFVWLAMPAGQGQATSAAAVAPHQAPAAVCSIAAERIGVSSGRGAEYVAAENGIAYVNVGDALQVVDARTAASLKHVADIGSTSYVAALESNIAYVAGSSNGGLRIFDVSDPISPTMRSTYLGLRVVDVAVEGDFAYVIGRSGVSSSSGSALHILDVRNLDAPVLRGSYPLSPVLGQVVVANNVAYVSTLQSGLQLFDVSNPDAPTLLKTVPINEASGLAVAGGFAYVAGGGNIHAIDVTNPANPVIRGALAINSFAHYIQIQGSLAFVAARSAGLLIVDISVPAQPTLRSTYPIKGGAYDVAISGTVAYVAAGADGLELVDVSDPGGPAALARYSPPNESHDVFVAGATAFVADGTAGFKVVDLTNPALPTPRFTYDTPGTARAVRVVGERAYVADGPAGLLIFDSADLTDIRLAGFYDTPDDARAIALDGEYVYVADGSSLQILQTRPVGSPTHRATYNVAADDVIVAQGRAFVIGTGSLTILDVQNPAQTTLIASHSLHMQQPRVRVVGNIAYVSGVVVSGDRFNPLSQVFLILDVQDPAAPRELVRFTGAHHSQGMALAVENGLAITSNGIFDVRNPALPQRLGDFAPFKNIHISGEFVYAASGTAGIWIGRLVEKACPPQPFQQLLPLVLR
jgi:hypothetical protein